MDRSRVSLQLGRGLVAASLLAASLLAACASAPPAELGSPTARAWLTLSEAEAVLAGVDTIRIEEAALTQDTLVCRNEARVGTHLERRRCFTRSQLDRITSNTQDWLRSDGHYGEVSTLR